MITIAGMGFGEKNAVTIEAIEAMKEVDKVILRTVHHPSVELLREEGIDFEALDYMYETIEDFEKLYQSIAEYVFDQAKDKSVCYVVPGSPSIAESTVKRLREMTDDIKYIEAVSFIEPCFSLAKIDPVEGALFLDAMDVDIANINPRLNIMITQAWNEFLLSDVKLKLMEIYDDEKIVYAINNAGIKNEETCDKIFLYELDRKVKADIRLTIIVPAEKISGPMDIIKAAMEGKSFKKTGFDEVDRDKENLYKILFEIGENINEGLYDFKDLFTED